MSGSARYQRQYRARQREGRVCVLLDIDEEDLVTLGEAGVLDPMQDHSREEIGLAIERLLKLLRSDAYAPVRPQR
jgi:hypothetical protein